MTWQYLDGAGTQFGFEEEQFNDLLNQGLIGPETQVWSEGMAEWLPAAQVWPDVFPAADAAPKVKVAKRRKPATGAAAAASTTSAAAEAEDPKNQKPPVWVIAPAIVCGALAVVLGFGLIPSVFGFGAAGLCIGISKLKWGLAARVWSTIGVTVAAWVICIPLVMILSGAANKMLAAHEKKQEQIEREAKREQDRLDREARQAEKRKREEEQRKLTEAKKKMDDDVNFFREGLDEFKPKPPGSPATPDIDPIPTPPESAPEPDKPERSREVPVGFAASEFAGGQGGSEFYDHHTGLAPMLGFECRFKTWTDQQAPTNLRTLYSRDETPERDDLVHFLAEPGFAVGGMETEGENHIYAIRLTFMAIKDDGSLDPNDTYQSDWIGEPREEQPYFTRFFGQGAPVLGLAGRGGMVTDAVGILYAETAATSFSVVRPDPTTVSVPPPSQKPDDPAAAERMRNLKVDSLASAGSILRDETDKDKIRDAAEYIVLIEDAAERNRLAKPLAQVLKPHLQHTNQRTQEKVAQAFAFVAAREDSAVLEALAKFNLDEKRKVVGYGMAGLLKADGFKARGIYEERFTDGKFRSAVNDALRECKQEEWVYPLLEVKNIQVYEEALNILKDIGTARSISTVNRSAQGLWPANEQSRVDQLAKGAADALARKPSR